jgi:hypothetical protein
MLNAETQERERLIYCYIYSRARITGAVLSQAKQVSGMCVKTVLTHTKQMTT